MENLETNSENIVKPTLDNKERAYATGKRKNSIARVWLKRGDGKISVNGKSLDKLSSEPGKIWDYSDAGVAILSILFFTIAGQNIHEYRKTLQVSQMSLITNGEG